MSHSTYLGETSIFSFQFSVSLSIYIHIKLLTIWGKSDIFVCVKFGIWTCQSKFKGVSLWRKHNIKILNLWNKFVLDWLEGIFTKNRKPYITKGSLKLWMPLLILIFTFYYILAQLFKHTPWFMIWIWNQETWIFRQVTLCWA